MALVESYFGEYQAGDNSDLQPIDSLSSDVMCRFSRQGRIAVVNRGPMGRGFRVCEICGHATPAPAPDHVAGRTRKHKDPRRPGRDCQGSLAFRQLGHEFLTDVVEIRFNDPRMADDRVGEAFSMRYLRVCPVSTSGVKRWTGRCTSTMCAEARRSFSSTPSPGGRTRSACWPAPSRGARRGRKVAEHCECGEESSCYACLRTYSNQIWHEQLVRRLAAGVLRSCV